MIEIKDISKTYNGEKKALNDISFDINDGEIFGFIGHNGAGKTTMIKSLVGILDFDKKIKGFANPDSILTGVETRSSSPVRIVRNEECMSNIKGIYPAGEGAGYAGGIMTAALDGIKCAIKILERNDIN